MGAPGPSTVLTLQRAAGNRATVSAIRDGSAGALSATRPTLSRCSGGVCKCGGACKKSGQSDELLGELHRHARG